MSDALNIRKIPATQLNPASYNPRIDLKAGDAEYEKLLRSVEEFGYVEPVIWNERTGNIVGGHQRFKVLTQLGYTEIDCVVVNMDEQREKALNVALNKISGDWDLPKLADLMHDLEDSGVDWEITGFEQPEIDKLYQKMQRERGEVIEDDFDTEQEIAAIETPVTQLGDIWLLGKHRLMCGDSTDPAAVARLMAIDPSKASGGAEGNISIRKARMVFTDPPWNVDYGGAAHPSWKQRQIMNDKMSVEDFYKFLLAAFKSMASASEAGCMTYVVMSAQEWGSVMQAMKEAGYHWSSTIIWAKDSHVMSRKDYQKCLPILIKPHQRKKRGKGLNYSHSHAFLFC